ncbi:MAG: ABC transporter permease [Lachnoclostridium sp.]|jgi:ABC-2 type transport system permease protein
MELFAYSILLQWKRNLRNKDILLVYYLIPLGFWALMGAIFSAINPLMKKELIQVLTVVAVSTGALLGVPISLSESYTSEIKKIYITGNIKLWIGVVSNFISAFFHLSIVCVIIFLFTPIIFQAEKTPGLNIYIPSLALFMITSIGLGSVIGMYVKNQSKLTIYSQIAYMPSIMLSGIMFDASLLPKVLEAIGKLFPATWGFLAIKSSEISLRYFMPQFIIFGISVILIIVRLVRIMKE